MRCRCSSVAVATSSASCNLAISTYASATATDTASLAANASTRAASTRLSAASNAARFLCQKSSSYRKFDREGARRIPLAGRRGAARRRARCSADRVASNDASTLGRAAARARPASAAALSIRAAAASSDGLPINASCSMRSSCGSRNGVHQSATGHAVTSIGAPAPSVFSARSSSGFAGRLRSARARALPRSRSRYERDRHDLDPTYSPEHRRCSLRLRVNESATINAPPGSPAMTLLLPRLIRTGLDTEADADPVPAVDDHDGQRQVDDLALRKLRARGPVGVVSDA